MISKYARTNTRWPIHNFSYIPSLSFSLWHFLALSHTPFPFSSLSRFASLPLYYPFCHDCLCFIGHWSAQRCMCVCVCAPNRSTLFIWLRGVFLRGKASAAVSIGQPIFFCFSFPCVTPVWLCPTRFVHTDGRKTGEVNRVWLASSKLVARHCRPCPLVTHPFAIPRPSTGSTIIFLISIFCNSFYAGNRILPLFAGNAIDSEGKQKLADVRNVRFVRSSMKSVRFYGKCKTREKFSSRVTISFEEIRFELKQFSPHFLVNKEIVYRLKTQSSNDLKRAWH